MSRAPDPDIYAAALRKVARGDWEVDVNAGLVTSTLRRRGPMGALTGGGYLSITLRDGGLQRNALVHRVVWAVAHDVADFPELNHMNGLKADNRLANLELSSPLHNSVHAWSTGLNDGHRGVAHPSSRLTDELVRELRARRAAGASWHQLASEFGVTHASARSAAIGASWKHVQ